MHGATIIIMIMQLWYDPNQQPLRKKNCSNLKICKIYVLHEIICFCPSNVGIVRLLKPIFYQPLTSVSSGL